MIPLVLLTFLGNPPAAHAQHQHPAPDSSSFSGHDMAAMMKGPLGISHERMGSGTSWMPDASVMHANHKMWGGWSVMLHGVAFGQYDYQGSKRGSDQLGIIDWEMVMAMRPVGTGKLHLHAMASLEPLTIGARGYPLLLQTGESYKGEPLHDRQHPHDALMELAAMFQQPIARNLAVELYGGIAGEPALGPVAFMHRPSAQSDPLAPLGHHWQDATHISFGVLTAGIYSQSWKLEGSAFNGREPDENRWNVDLRRLDSYSGRLTFNPVREWSFSGWYGYLPSPEQLHPEESVHRFGASALHSGRGIRGGSWNSTLLFAANDHGGHRQGSVLGETNFELGSRNSFFARAELVQKSAEDLVLTGIDPERTFDVKSLVAGYMREIQPIPGGTIGIGGRVSVNFISDALGRFYGTGSPKGFDVYVRIRPKRMEAQGMEMKGMDMNGMPAGKSAAGPAESMSRMPMEHGTTVMHDDPTMHHDSAMHREMKHSIGGAADSVAAVAAVEAYRAALVAGDTSSAIGMLDVNAIVLESGEMETRQEYITHHLEADMAFAKAVASRSVVHRVRVIGDIAWVASTSHSKGTFSGRAIDSDGAELIVLHRVGGMWKIGAIHWSSRRRNP